MKRSILLTVVAMAGTLAIASARSAEAPAPRAAFALDSTWNDGKAEVITYAMTDSVSGTYEARLVIRKKPGTANPEVLEMIYDDGVRRAAVDLDRKTLRSIEYNASWGDSIHKARVGAETHTNGLLYASRTDQRNLTVPIPCDACRPFYYDVLPSMLRVYDLTSPGTFAIRMLPTQWTGDETSASLLEAEVVLLGRAGKPSATSHGGLGLEVRYQGKTDRMWFHPGPGHVLLVWERADGKTLTFKKNERRVYE